MKFEEWWYNTGSGIGVKPGDDYEEHAKRVAQAAWEAAQLSIGGKQSAMTELNENTQRFPASASPTCSADNRIAKLEDMLFERGAMNEPPCFCCGYNGSGYYQPSTHPCAERHHRLSR